MKAILAGLALLALAACGAKEEAAPPAGAAKASAPAGGWIVDKAASRLSFTGAQGGAAFTGAFSNFDATIVLDPADLAAAKIEVVVAMGSATTGDRQRDDALLSSDWFAVKSFPTASFSSSALAATGEGAYEATGALTIRDISRDLTLPFTLTIENGRAVADGAVTLMRADYGVGQGEFADDKWAGLEVKVEYHVEARR